MERDFAADVIADSVQEFRSQLVAAAVGDDAAKETYKTSQRAAKFKLLEAYVAKYGGGENGSVAAGEGATYADCVVFALLWDESRLFTTDMIQVSYCNDLCVFVCVMHVYVFACAYAHCVFVCAKPTAMTFKHGVCVRVHACVSIFLCVCV